MGCYSSFSCRPNWSLRSPASARKSLTSKKNIGEPRQLAEDSLYISSLEQTLWECPIWRQRTPFGESFNKELIAELHGIAQGLRDKTDTRKTGSLLDYDRPRLNELMAQKIAAITSATSHFFPQNQRATFKPLTSWLNVNETGEHIGIHAHPLSAMACTYYIRSPDNGGDFYYVDTGRVGEHKTEVRYIKPSTGDLLFFPSYVLHGVTKNLGRLRISLSSDFDYKLTSTEEGAEEARSFVNNMAKINH